MNLYDFVLNSPLCYLDLLGKQAEEFPEPDPVPEQAFGDNNNVVPLYPEPDPPPDENDMDNPEANPELNPNSSKNTNQPSVKSFVLMSNYVAITKGNCGIFSLDTQWLLDPFSRNGGYIVQHVKIDEEVSDCQHPASSKSIDYDERWTVTGFPAVGNNGSHPETLISPNTGGDFLSINAPLKDGCSNGKITWTLEAGFYQAVPYQSFVYQPEGPSGNVPIRMPSVPIKGILMSNLVERKVVASWDCCGGDSETKVSWEGIFGP